jgi:hypothetical protein
MTNKQMDTKIIRVPWTKNENKIFGAFEWNAYVLGMYEDIFKEINNKYGWKIQYGAKHILTIDKAWKNQIKPDDIEIFINRNKQLYDIFVKGISSCNLFIADITNHNPNVLLELGIAIQLNKNIIIVTSQDVKDLPFDIRGIEAKKYKTKQDLYLLIEKEIEMYELIKNQTFKQGKYVPTKKYSLPEKEKIISSSSIKLDRVPDMKNLRMKVDFRFIYSANHDWDWFGINFRTQGPWNYNSELVLIRYTGITRSLTFPEKRKENDTKMKIDFKPEEWNTLEVLIDEGKLSAWVGDKLVLEDTELIIGNYGEIWLSGMDHHGRLNNPVKNGNGNYLETEFANIEILDLDTTANLFEK